MWGHVLSFEFINELIYYKNCPRVATRWFSISKSNMTTVAVILRMYNQLVTGSVQRVQSTIGIASHFIVAMRANSAITSRKYDITWRYVHIFLMFYVEVHSVFLIWVFVYCNSVDRMLSNASTEDIVWLSRIRICSVINLSCMFILSSVYLFWFVILFI